MKFNLNKRKDIVVLVGIFVVFLVGVILLVGKSFSNKKDIFVDYSVVGGILNTDDVKDTKIRVKDSSLSIADRYDTKKASIKESREDMYFGNLKGKILFVKGEKEDLNVFQGIYNVEPESKDDQPSLMKVNEYINNFKSAFYSMVSINSDTKPVEEKLYGESKYWFKIPVEESVYVEKRLYSLSYKIEVTDDLLLENLKKDVKEIVYELNFYMKGKELVCELVRLL